ncbi:FxDxF family PEP-CTERM protein [Duganella sp. S19_KUP01_CR8]|uniref:FxDxF family PEP-CTERM protein n=1 Tax=Duganella sp. S19_KUP01_CR8 TaxID=3025502 RepID=UPI002FCDD2FA
MIKVKVLVGAIAMAGAALLSQGAFAADISNPDTPLDLSSGADFGGHFITGGHKDDTFADKYTFTLTGASTISADVYSHSGNARNGLDISGLALYNAGGLLLGGNQLSTGETDQWQLDSAVLGAGSYYVLISGHAMSNSSGVYSSGVTVTAVPEPETYAMLLGGLGLIGAMVSRRQRKQA